MKLKNILLFCGVLLLAVQVGWADSCIWEIEKDGKKALIGASCLLPGKDTASLSPTFQKAYARTRTLVFETDNDRIASADFQKKAIITSIYKDGTTLKDHLSPKAYQKLQSACGVHNLKLEQFNAFKLPTILTLLTAMELKQAGILSMNGVDLYFHNQAKKDRKAMKQLESPEAQIQLITAVTDGIEDEYLQYSLQKMKDPKAKYAKISEAWLAGDVKKLAEALLGDMETKYPRVYQKLILDRNAKWLPEIERLLQTPEQEFILIGAANLLGKGNLLQMLKDRGYTVRPFQAK